MSHSPLRQMTEADFRTYLADQLLVKVDRASMLVSLEVRAPWLDYRIVEFAFGCVPDPLKWTGKERKILPKVLAKRLLPGNFDLKRKQGFTMPLASWFKGEWGSYMESVLQGADSLLFDPSVIRELIASQRRGNNNFQRLFLLTMFELWRREYRVTVPNR
jgi:asparagine synthase (glutamine-hydrolysing)